MMNLVSVCSHAHTIHMVKVGSLPTNTTLFIYKAGIYISPDILTVIQ
jgi:hypothetical protein